MADRGWKAGCGAIRREPESPGAGRLFKPCSKIIPQVASVSRRRDSRPSALCARGCGGAHRALFEPYHLIQAFFLQPYRCAASHGW